MPREVDFISPDYVFNHHTAINDKDYAKYPLYQHFLYHKRNKTPEQNNNKTQKTHTRPHPPPHPHAKNLTGLMSNTKTGGLVHSL